MAVVYNFLTTWLLEAERERVWDVIYASEDWPRWWRGVVRAERTDEGDEHGLGQAGEYEWRSWIPYPVRFQIVTTTVERPYLLAGSASGDLEGTGSWRFFEERSSDGPVTAVVYAWDVRTTKRWMNAIGPIARPVFEWNHDYVMRAGGRGMADLLGCRLVSAG